jgi:uncharacterized iron-regulated membrane protein
MQILWAALDLISIIVLGSGLYLWIAKRRRNVSAGNRAAAASA